MYNASSYDINKVVSIDRDDFKCPKTVKDPLALYGVGLFTCPGCVVCVNDESMTTFLLPYSIGARHTGSMTPYTPHFGD